MVEELCSQSPPCEARRLSWILLASHFLGVAKNVSLFVSRSLGGSGKGIASSNVREGLTTFC
jgi:hypothetical protein